MKVEKKQLLIKYAICFLVASLITVIVFWAKDFFTDSLAVNIQVLSDGFSVSGILFVLFAGLLYVSGEGALLGLTFVVRHVILTFIPMGRKQQETYAQYRERKIGKVKKSHGHCILFTGLFFLAIGVVFTVIWYVNFYQVA